MVALQSCGWAAAPFGYFQDRGHGKMGAVRRNPLTAIPLAALSLQPECTAWEGGAEPKKARPVKPKGIGPELGRDAYLTFWVEHKVKTVTFYSIGHVPSTSPSHWLHWRRYKRGPTWLENSQGNSQCQQRQILFQTCAFPFYAKLGL